VQITGQATVGCGRWAPGDGDAEWCPLAADAAGQSCGYDGEVTLDGTGNETRRVRLEYNDQAAAPPSRVVVSGTREALSA
jgi:hypothetical protein